MGRAIESVTTRVSRQLEALLSGTPIPFSDEIDPRSQTMELDNIYDRPHFSIRYDELGKTGNRNIPYRIYRIVISVFAKRSSGRDAVNVDRDILDGRDQMAETLEKDGGRSINGRAMTSINARTPSRAVLILHELEFQCTVFLNEGEYKK